MNFRKMNKKCQKITTKIRKKNKRNEKINKTKISLNFKKQLFQISKNDY